MSNEVDYVPRKYVGNGSTTEFQFDWKVFKDNELIITFEDIHTSEKTTPILHTDYTVFISNYGGGKVIFKTAPTSDKFVIIERDVSNKQGTKYSTSTGFQGSQLEKDFDRISCNIQEIEYKLNKKYQFLDDAKAENKYPRFAVNRASFDVNGNPNFIVFNNNTLTAKADFIYTTASGYTHEVYNDLILNTSGYAIKEYNIIVNYRNFEHSIALFDNRIFKQIEKPDGASIGDMWLNMALLPNLLFIYTSSGWKYVEPDSDYDRTIGLNSESVPIGTIDFATNNNSNNDLPLEDVYVPEEPPSL